MHPVYLLFHKNFEIGKDVYVGSTSKSLAKRFASHKNDSLRIGYEENKLYKRMRKLGHENWIIRPLLSLDCRRDEIRKFERMWCKILRSDLNTLSPFTSAEERKEYQIAHAAAYRKENREFIKRKKAERYVKNRDSKKFFCKLCEKTFCKNSNLKRHFNSLTHQFGFLNLLD